MIQLSSSRNSEVIHAGIYYTKNSLKARLCVRGKEALYAYSDSRSIPYRRCGKLIVATAPSQIGELHALRGKAEGNGVFDLQWLRSAGINRYPCVFQFGFGGARQQVGLGDGGLVSAASGRGSIDG